jgi:hypothetical protein|nr:MAG TPA: GIY-YIG nuclease superfamily protein [Caudoviricetes sp.]
MIVHEYYTISVEVWQYKISRKVEFMDYQSIDYFSLASMVTDWMRYAGPNARKDFMDLVRSTDYNRRAAIENDLGDGYVLDFAVDHSDIMNEVGQFLVYLFIDNNGEIYYVGMGNEQRIMDKKSRNNDFLKHYMKHNSKIVILSKWSTRKIALKIEKMAIWICQMNGFRLTNIKEVLSPKQLYELRHIPENKENETETQYEYRQLTREFSEEVKALDRIEQWLYEDGASKTPGFVNTKENVIWAMECWTIDGVTKTRSQWCKENNVSLAGIGKRLELGCTPKEALTFPTAPDNRKRHTKEWWAENGYFPGTDKTSYITPLNEWPKGYKKCKIARSNFPPDMVSDC